MIIGFTGKKRSGKSEMCKHLRDNYPNVVQVNFKDGLTRELKEKFGILLEEIALTYKNTVDWLFEEKPPLMRKLYQCFGTEVRRGDDPDWWINIWHQTAFLEIARGNSVIADDVRFLNEAQSIKDVGGVVIRIVRTDIKNDDPHKSELEMDSIVVDYEIVAGLGDVPGACRDLDKIINNERKKKRLSDTTN